MTDAPANDGSGLPLPKWVLWLALPGAIAPIGIFAFILFTESAHDPARCPFRDHERRELAPNVFVVEEARRCLDDVEERRFHVERGGRRQLLGERRFAPSAFATGVYSWQAAIEEGQARVRIEQTNHGVVVFREGTDEERARKQASER
jgi:hypothetical protein